LIPVAKNHWTAPLPPPGAALFVSSCGLRRSGRARYLSRDMSDRASIYAAPLYDSAEVQRALQICLAGMTPPAVLTFPGGVFPAWAARVFLKALAPHAVQVRELAIRGEAGLLVRMDAALELPPASAPAGWELLARREGARHLPATRRFAAAVAGGASPGHFATVFALQAAEFSVAVLPMLQGLLYCEWHAARPSHEPCALPDFLRLAGAELAALPALLAPHAHDAALPRLAAVR